MLIQGSLGLSASEFVVGAVGWGLGFKAKASGGLQGLGFRL